MLTGEMRHNTTQGAQQGVMLLEALIGILIFSTASSREGVSGVASVQRGCEIQIGRELYGQKIISQIGWTAPILQLRLSRGQRAALAVVAKVKGTCRGAAPRPYIGSTPRGSVDVTVRWQIPAPIRKQITEPSPWSPPLGSHAAHTTVRTQSQAARFAW